MPPSVWTEKEERDLLLAIVVSHLAETKPGTGDLKVKINWGKVHEQMAGFGYTFTESAISQRLSKRILVEYKQALKDGEGKVAAPDGAAAAKATPTKRKAKIEAAGDSEASTKKPKTAKTAKKQADDQEGATDKTA